MVTDSRSWARTLDAAVGVGGGIGCTGFTSFTGFTGLTDMDNAVCMVCFAVAGRVAVVTATEDLAGVSSCRCAPLIGARAVRAGVGCAAGNARDFAVCAGDVDGWRPVARVPACAFPLPLLRRGFLLGTKRYPFSEPARPATCLCLPSLLAPILTIARPAQPAGHSERRMAGETERRRNPAPRSIRMSEASGCCRRSAIVRRIRFSWPSMNHLDRLRALLYPVAAHAQC